MMHNTVVRATNNVNFLGISSFPTHPHAIDVKFVCYHLICSWRS